ncbi:MAG TPA: HAD family hydrolase [Gemmatimonadaceae bacterium]|nr:HAD family hydrolase [Gemmatimonadaceae bacterium]
MRPNIEALIFDVDGTLVDTNAAHVEVWRTVLSAIGLDIAPERIAREIGQGGDRLLHALLGPADAARLGPGLLLQWPETYRTHLRSADVRAFPGTRELFAALRARSIRVACATSSSRPLMAALLESVAIEAPDIMVTGEDVKATKPAPDIVRVAAERLNVQIERCVHVGDTPYDAMAATAAGAKSWGVLTGSHSEATLRAAGAERIWADVSALYADLDKLLPWAQKSNA